MPLRQGVAKGQVFAGEWMKLEHVSTGGGKRGHELKTGAGDLHSTTSKHMCRNLEVPPEPVGCYQNTFVMQKQREHMLFDSG